jgi:hypothetical protein
MPMSTGKAGAESIPTERLLPRVNECDIVGHHRQQTVQFPGVDGCDPGGVDRPDFLFIESCRGFVLHDVVA